MTEKYAALSPERALIWRITHAANLPWLLEHGLHCQNSGQFIAGWKDIGNVELIDKRAARQVPLEPHGTLADYIPFYFTPFSPMMYNIHTGMSVPHTPNSDTVILVSSLAALESKGIDYVHTDGHAYMQTCRFYNQRSNLDVIDWELLKSRDFSRDSDDPKKMERYQAEALVYRHLPVEGLEGLVCYNDSTKVIVEVELSRLGLTTPIKVIPDWYF